MNLLLALILPTIVSAGVTCAATNHLGDPAQVVNANNDGCDDIDECADDNLNDCSTLGVVGAEGSICVNAVEPTAIIDANTQQQVGAGFTCQCDVANGYVMDGTNPKIAHFMYADCSKFCEIGMYGTFNQLGDPAYEFAGLDVNGVPTCQDINECSDVALNDCTEDGSICTNSLGPGFDCSCDTGYEETGAAKNHSQYVSCVDIDECPIGGTCMPAGIVECVNSPGSYECVCLDTHTGDSCALDADECTAGTANCTEHSTCNNLVFDYECVCDIGWESDDSAGACPGPDCDNKASCVDVDECRDGWDSTFYNNAEGAAIGDMHGGNAQGAHGCHYSSICTNTQGNYTCSCNATIFTNPEGGEQGDYCLDIDECSTNTHNCDANAECTNTYGGYTCACNAGFEATTETAQDDNPVCIDIDECPIGGTCMPAGISECVNSPGSYECVCLDSHTGDSCALDADECTTGTATCPEHSTCNNLVFDYECVCDIGWESSVADLCPGPDCDNKASCVDVDECRDGWDSADTANGGFYDNGAESTAIGDMHGGNAGNVHGCNYLAICTNTEGNYTCSCGAGFTGTGEMSTSDFCTDIDECSDETDECDANADCANTQGDYTCTCSTGWEATAATAQDDKQVCIDTDECATNHGGCHANATCTNNDGGHECACVEGYFGNGNLCAEINECEAHAAPGKGPMIGGDHDCHINATCTNTDGSYSCDCEVGTAGNGTYCAESCDDQVYVDHAEWGRLTCENLVNEDRCADDNVYLYCCATCDVLTASSTVLSTALPQLLSAMIAVFYLF